MTLGLSLYNGFSLLPTCLCIHTCNVCECAPVGHVCLPLSFSTLFFEAVSLGACRAHQLVRMVVYRAPGSFLSPPSHPSTRVTDKSHHARLLHECWGSKPRSSGFAQQALYQPSHLPSQRSTLKHTCRPNPMLPPFL